MRIIVSNQLQFGIRELMEERKMEGISNSDFENSVERGKIHPFWDDITYLVYNDAVIE